MGLCVCARASTHAELLWEGIFISPPFYHVTGVQTNTSLTTIAMFSKNCYSVLNLDSNQTDTDIFQG